MNPADQYLTFALGQEQYGLEILRVQEIRRYPPITPIPNAPPHVRGVMNLRGIVVPVVDLRARFGLPEAGVTPSTVVIIVAVGGKVVGLIVDAVSDVLDLGREAIDPPPDLGGSVDTSLMTGVARSGDRLTLLLDLDRLVTGAALFAT